MIVFDYLEHYFQRKKMRRQALALDISISKAASNGKITYYGGGVGSIYYNIHNIMKAILRLLSSVHSVSNGMKEPV